MGLRGSTPHLTEREIAVCRGRADGLAVGEIADRLGIAPGSADDALDRAAAVLGVYRGQIGLYVNGLDAAVAALRDVPWDYVEGEGEWI